MPELRLEGCRPHPLAGYLKALGLTRAVGRQGDPQARARWARGALELATALDRDQLEMLLLDRYEPAPVVSPWNGGSGFYPKDNRDAIDAIEASEDPRLGPFQRALAIARAALEQLGIVEKPADRMQKLNLLRVLQATLPDDALDWLEAAVVLTGADDVEYPPLLGSGGNDGRFDIANNYAQAVVAALDSSGRERAERWLRAALDRESAPLVVQSMAHLQRDASPVSSPMGEADALSNPWDLILGIEGALVLIAGAARRTGVIADTAMAAPFTVRATAAGYGSAVPGERGRAELWMPLWSRWMSLAELETLMREGRAQVGRRAARSGLDLARAAAQLGVDRGIDAFERYALLERAGQSTLAVPAGRIDVRERPAAGALASLEPWLGRVLGYGAGDVPRAHAQAIRALERAAFGLAERGDPASAHATIEALGAVESVLASTQLPAAVSGLRPFDGVSALPWLQAADDGSGELAVAAVLASLCDLRGSDAPPAVRDYIHGTRRDERGNRRYGGSASGQIERRTGTITRLAQLHRRRHLDAQRQGDGAEGTGPPAGKGARPYAFGLDCPLPLAIAFARGDGLDEERIGRLLAGLCLFDYFDVFQAQWRPAFHGPMLAWPPYELLALAWAGTANRRRSEATGARASSDVPPVVLGPRPGWAALLAARKVEPVIEDAVLRLRIALLAPIPTADDLRVPNACGPRLAAALLLRLSESDRRAIAARRCAPTAEPLEGAA